MGSTLQENLQRFQNEVEKPLQNALSKPKAFERHLFQSIIPSVLYCIAIWGSCTKSIMFKINNIHLKAARFI